MGAEPSFIHHLRTKLIDGGAVATDPEHGALAPFAVFDAPRGFADEVWTSDQPDTVLSIRLRGAAAISQVPGFEGLSTDSGQTVSLQPIGGCNHYLAADAIRFAHFYITDGLLARVAEGRGLAKFDQGSLRHDMIMADEPDLWRLIASYGERAIDRVNPASRIELEARALLVVDRLIGVHHGGRPNTRPRGGLAPRRLKRALEALEAHVETDITLDDLAEIAGCSPTHFSRAFKQSVGVAPFIWLSERRIARAQTLLRDPSRSLAEIALLCGFSAQPQFTTAFRRATGVTPGAWRRARSY